MAKLYFKYGTMGSSKTAQVLMTKFNYEEKGKKVLLLKPAIDNRDGDDIIKSRIGLSSKVIVVFNDIEINKQWMLEILENTLPDVVIVDECQFFSRCQILQLRNIVDELNIPVLCFGLRTNFKSELFEGSKTLFEIADSISEIKSICECGNKSIINAKINDGKIIYNNSPEIDIGSNDKYIGMCFKCWASKMTSDEKSIFFKKDYTNKSIRIIDYDTAENQIDDIIKYIKSQFETQCTAYGEPQAWLHLTNNRSIEITLEQEGLREDEYFYSIRLNCTDEEFNDHEYYSTCGIIENYCCDIDDNKLKNMVLKILKVNLTTTKEISF